MADRTRLKAAFERNQKAIRLRPGIARGTASTRVRLRDAGGACEIEDGPWRLVAGLQKGEGGDGAGPDPGVLGRAALGSCLAMGYLLWSALLDVPVNGIEVQVQADYDARGAYGVADQPPGWTALRYIVTVENAAPEADLLRVLDAADAHSPLLDDLRRPLEISREVRIVMREALRA